MLALFWQVATFRRGPEDMPVSAGWLVAAMLLQGVVAVVIQQMLPALPAVPGVADHTLPLLLIDIVMTLLWGWVLLRIVGAPERFLQMLTAIFGCQLVFQPMLVPVQWLAAHAPKGSAWDLPSELLLVALSVWVLVALARILRSATGWPLAGCVVLVIAQGVAAFLVAMAIFPDIAASLKTQAA